MKTELEERILLVNQENIDKAALPSQFVFKDDNTLVFFTSKKGEVPRVPLPRVTTQQ
jgi:hypothetical protein